MHVLSILIFFIIGPAEKRNRHIKILSSISKIAKDQELVDSITNAETPDLLNSLIQRDSERSEVIETAGKQEITKCQIMIHVQNEILFQDVLEILSSEVEGSVTVLESSSASAFLHRLPLFSTFWNENTNKFSKTIIALLDKRFMNDAIRRINMIRPEDGTGILITVQDVIYADGAIDF